MDKRHEQIREGAGLEESRINQDFKDFLIKWGPRILIVAAIVLGGYSGLRYYRQAQADRIDAAFAEYNALVTSGIPSPEALIAVAEAHSSVRALPLIARLQAADLYMRAVISGLEPGFDPTTDLNEQGEVVDESMLLDEQARGDYLERAETLYRGVLDASRDNPDRRLHAIGAAFGLGAVAQSRGELDAAREMYELAESLAASGEYGPLAEVARSRLAGLDEPVTLPTVYEQSELPEPPGDVAPPAPDADGSTGLPGGLSTDIGELFGPPEPDPSPEPSPVPSTPPAPTDPDSGGGPEDEGSQAPAPPPGR